MIGYVDRDALQHQRFKGLIDKGSLGEIYYAKASKLKKTWKSCGWFSDKSRSSGVGLIDIGFM